MRRNTPVSIDQTSFVDQMPVNSQSKDDFNLKDNLKRNRNLRPFYIVILIMLLIVFLYALVLIFVSPAKEEDTLVRENSTVLELDPLQKEVEQLKSDLRAADPTRQSLPFPSVDLEFGLE